MGNENAPATSKKGRTPSFSRLLYRGWLPLRLRFSLWVVLIFCITGTSSFWLQNKLTSRHVVTSTNDFMHDMKLTIQERRKGLEGFLTHAFLQQQAALDILLAQNSEATLQGSRFFSLQKKPKGSWLDAAELMEQNKSISVVRSLQGTELSSFVVGTPEQIKNLWAKPINETLAWIFYADENGGLTPEVRLGVKVPICFAHQPEKTAQTPWTLYLIFALDQLKAIERKVDEISPQQDPIPLPWAREYALDLAGVEKGIQLATGWSAQAFSQTDYQPALPASKTNPLDSSIVQALQDWAQLVEKNNLRTYLTWALAALFESNSFDEPYNNNTLPLGAALVWSGKESQGQLLLTKEVFLEDELPIADSSHFCGTMPSGSQLHAFLIQGHLYIGCSKSQQLLHGENDRIDSLTLAIDGELLAQQIALATSLQTIISYNDHWISAYNGIGEKEPSMLNHPLLPANPSAWKEPAGRVSDKDIAISYLRLEPIPFLNIQVFLLDPDPATLQMLKHMEANVSAAAWGISQSIHIIGIIGIAAILLLLFHLIGRVTEPISQLAIATKKLSDGTLQIADIPIPIFHDEIYLLCVAFSKMVQNLEEKERVRSVLNKVVSSEIAQEILKGNVHLGGEERRGTILFGDIRNFTNMTQNMLPHETIALLNECMTIVATIIEKHGGVIDKFVGDAVMALFGLPVEKPGAALRAVQAALAITLALEAKNEERKAHKLPVIHMGIGIHTGCIFAGNMGAERRMNYTVIGSNVNKASRICSQALGAEVLVSEETAQEPMVAEQIELENLPPTKLKGFDEPVKLLRAISIKKTPL